jgi:hypothetical protein
MRSKTVKDHDIENKIPMINKPFWSILMLLLLKIAVKMFYRF